MKYRAGYKYQLTEDEIFKTPIITGQTFESQFVTLNSGGVLFVKSGYAWDGPSGPTYDSKNALRASLAHDALYQLMRIGDLDISWRDKADLTLDRILEKDGMSSMRRWYWLKGVQWFAGGAADPDNAKPILEAS